ncbi:MAG: hypothetical protein ACE5FF_15805, partial [Saprospiraceae bacterium]
LLSLLSIFLISLFSITSCTAQDAFDPSTEDIAEVVSGDTVLAITDATLEQAVINANSNISSLTEYELVVLPDTLDYTDTLYLMVHTRLSSGETHLIVLDLKVSGTGFQVNFSTTGDTCTGFCCARCKFGGLIIKSCYCWVEHNPPPSNCVDGEGNSLARCDHSTTTDKSTLIDEVQE